MSVLELICYAVLVVAAIPVYPYVRLLIRRGMRL